MLGPLVTQPSLWGQQSWPSQFLILIAASGTFVFSSHAVTTYKKIPGWNTMTMTAGDSSMAQNDRGQACQGQDQDQVPPSPPLLFP